MIPPFATALPRMALDMAGTFVFGLTVIQDLMTWS